MSDIKNNRRSTKAVNSLGDPIALIPANEKFFKPITENRITRNNPCPIVILIDQSGSMGRSYINSKNESKRISEEVTDAINHFFEHLIFRSTSGSEIRQYFTFLLIGYGNQTKENYATLAWEGNLMGKDWVTVKELSENIIETSTKIETKVHHWGEQYQEKTTKKIWIYPKSDGKNTPMLSALELCKSKLEEFVAARIDNFPPVIFNLTDGLPTDVSDLKELEKICCEIKNIKTSFGNSILFNCLLSSLSENRVFLPRLSEVDAISTNKYHASLFESSSVLPDFILEEAYKMFKDEKFNGAEPIKSVVLNVEPSSLTQLLKIGTRTTK